MSGPRKSDPVCGQTIDPLRARAVAIVAGERYYFCSVEHRDRFAADPEHFLGQPGEAEALAALTREEPPAPAHEAEPAPPLTVHDLIPAAEAPLPAPARLVRFEIGGMSGPEDAERVRRALGRIPGVAQVELDVVTEIASVELRGDEADRRGDQTSARVVAYQMRVRTSELISGSRPVSRIQ